MPIDRTLARDMDHRDALASYRGRFVISDPELVYLDGNSLGRLVEASRARVHEVLEREWAGELISSWENHWLELPTRIGDLIGTGLLGVRTGEVLSTTRPRLRCIRRFRLLWTHARTEK